MAPPQVSVIMPVYNAVRYVAEAIESIRTQTFSDFELLIFDDGSTDGSLEVVQNYTKRDTRIRFFAKAHRGYVPWLNEGLRLSQGEFIARMDADDASLPERFAYQVHHLRQHDACVVVGCGTLIVDPDGDPLCEYRPHVDHATLISALISGTHGVITHPTSMMRRDALLRVGGYREEYEPIEDFDLWLRLAEVGQLANLPDILFRYRQHHASIMYTPHQVQRQSKWADTILTQARSRLGKEPLAYTCYSYQAPSRIERHRMWATWALIGRHRATALKHAWISFRNELTSPKSWALLLGCLLPFHFLSRLSRCGLSRSWHAWNNFPA